MVERFHDTVPAYRRQTTETLAKLGAVACLCLIAGWMVTQIWPETPFATTLQSQSSDSDVSGLEILKIQVRIIRATGAGHCCWLALTTRTEIAKQRFAP